MATPSVTHAEERRRRRRSALAVARTISTHPLLLLAVGAAVSGILVPTFTRGAQEHRQALELKSELVGEMSAAASPFLAATLANVIAHDGEVPPSYAAAYERWVDDGNQVWTKLRTYFPEADATQAWSSFMLRLRDVYYVFGVARGEESGAREEYKRRLSAYLSGGSGVGVESLGALPEDEQHTFMVDLDAIDEWLATPNRRFDDSVNFFTEELFFGLRTAMVRIQTLVLESEPRL